jgi:hypothetical protein
MSVYKHHSVIPENSKALYKEYDIIDFICSFPARKMLANTVRLSFTMRVGQNGANLVNEEIKWNSYVGSHNLLEGITTETTLQGQLESIHSYSRQVAMVAGATLDMNDLMNASKSCELRACDDEFSNIQLKGEKVKPWVDGDTNSENNSVSLKPHFCLNRASSADGSGDLGVSYAKTGNVRISLQLNRIYDALYGKDVNSTTSYNIYNPRIEFLSVADDGVKNTIQFQVSNSIKQLVNSSLSNLGLKAPVVATSCAVSFIEQARESKELFDNTKCEQLPNVSRLDFNWNNTTNQGITYTIRDNEEIIARYLEALRTAGHNSASLARISANKHWGVGISFGEAIDLSKTILNVQITSEVQSSLPYTAVFYFSGIISL